MSKKNNKTSEKGKPRLHTTISREIEELLEKYQNLVDEEGNPIYGNKSKVIEKSLELLDKYHNPEKEEIKKVWDRTREELNMVVMGKWTFLSFITGEVRKTVNENIAIDIIEWYKQKTVDDLSLIELLEAIQEIWVVMNYFKKIRINVGSKGSYQMSFIHDFHNKKYSDYWGDYFSQLLLTCKKCDVEYFSRKMSLILRINYDKALFSASKLFWKDRC